MLTSPNYSEGFALSLAVPLFRCCKGATCVGDIVTVPGFLVQWREDDCQAD